MVKPVTVEEFDVITSNPEYLNKNGYGVLEEPAFSRLVDFVGEFVENDEHAKGRGFGYGDGYG